MRDRSTPSGPWPAPGHGRHPLRSRGCSPEHVLAQAACYVAVAPKSNRAGQAYWAAMADVQQHGSQAVPPHLLNASHARMRSHGIGVGYRLPHDYDGGDVEQQYLPDLLVGRRYYRPTDQGMERQIADRLERIRVAREDATAAGGPRKARERGPQVDSMKVAGRVMRDRQAGAKAAGPAATGGGGAPGGEGDPG